RFGGGRSGCELCFQLPHLRVKAAGGVRLERRLRTRAGRRAYAESGRGPGGWMEKADDIVQALAPYPTSVAQEREGSVTGTCVNDGGGSRELKDFEERRTGGERGPRVKSRSRL